jgi:hypothetical protein
MPLNLTAWGPRLYFPQKEGLLLIFITLKNPSRSRSSSVIIVSDYGLDDRAIEFDPGRGKGFFLYPLCPDRF